MNARAGAIGSLIAALWFSVGGAVMADDLQPPPWRGGQYSTVAEWEFLGPLPVTPPDGAIPPVVGDGGGAPTATILGPMTWDPYDGDGAWIGSGPTPADFGIIDLYIPNWIDLLPVKFIRVQMTVQNSGMPGAVHVAGITASDPQGITGVQFVGATETLIPGTLGQLVHRVEDWRIFPNPDFENIRIIVPTDTLVDQIVVDTISIPEPATIGLLTLAGATLLRRRRVA